MHARAASRSTPYLAVHSELVLVVVSVLRVEASACSTATLCYTPWLYGRVFLESRSALFQWYTVSKYGTVCGNENPDDRLRTRTDVMNMVCGRSSAGSAINSPQRLSTCTM